MSVEPAKRFHRADCGNGEVLLMFYCPGCQEPHGVRVQGEAGVWEWNGDQVNATLSPSILVTRPPSDYCCHSYVRDGKIEFLGDCSHDLKGTTVEVPAWDSVWSP